MVGGESAGGGLTAALCMMARDRKEVNIAYQMPLYPMLDDHDTDSSRDNHAKVWNTRRNHMAWRMYLKGIKAAVDVYEGLYHAFDMNSPKLDISKEAIKRFNERFAYAKEHYFAEQSGDKT